MDLHHGDLLLMARKFQQNFKHRTIPATEWSTTTSTEDAYTMEAAQKCQLKPTQDQPRINITARYIKNHNCFKCQPPPPVDLPIEPPVELTPADACRRRSQSAPPPPPPPEPTPADAEAQEELRALRAKIEMHEAAEQEMQRQIAATTAELEQFRQEWLEELAERRDKKSKPNTKEIQSKLDEKSQKISRLRAKSLREAAAAALAEYSFTLCQQLKAFSRQLSKESCGVEDKLFISGQVHHSRLHRVLMRFDQLDYALTEAVGDADVETDHTEDLSKTRIVFTAGEGGAAGFDPRPETGVGDVLTAWRVINGVATTPFRAYLGQQLCISMFELSCEFHLGVHRTTLRAPSGRDKAAATKQFVKSWHHMFRAEKVRQHQDLKSGELVLPDLPLSYGPCTTLEAMPCIVWLNVEKGALKRARQMSA